MHTHRTSSTNHFMRSNQNSPKNWSINAWAVAVEVASLDSQSSPKARGSRWNCHSSSPTRKGTVSTRSNRSTDAAVRCRSPLYPARCPNILCTSSTRGRSGIVRYTVDIPPRVSILYGSCLSVTHTPPPSVSGAEGRKTKCKAKAPRHQTFAISLPLPSCTHSRMPRPAPCAAS
ncbi:hypothetical protein B0H13DRAFT_2048803 [Mycena leptocephala]|nr:hypothetical protein B0H13DRAFT_2048803 [Mycena leptocephala]